MLRHLRLAAGSPWRYATGLRAAAARGRQGLRDFARAGWLAGQLREDGVGHLHTHFISSPADVAELVSMIGGVPFSISAHAKDIYLSNAADLRRKMAAARFTVTCTDFNCRTLQAMAPAANVHRMYHGIDAAVFHPNRRTLSLQAPSLVPLILSVGRLREKKGLDTLIDACRLLHCRGVPFRCEIVGYGEEQARLAALIESHGLADQVQLVGKLAREQVVERYARAAVYVQPSRAWPPMATAMASPTCCSKPWRWACRWWPHGSRAFPSWWSTATTACCASPTTRQAWPSRSSN